MISRKKLTVKSERQTNHELSTLCAVHPIDLQKKIKAINGMEKFAVFAISMLKNWIATGLLQSETELHESGTLDCLNQELDCLN